MAQDITPKQSNFVARYAQAVTTLIDDINRLVALKAEWDANGFATGAPAVDGTAWNIPDAQVQAQLPAATAAMLNSAVGGVASVISAFNANVGYLIVLKP